MNSFTALHPIQCDMHKLPLSQPPNLGFLDIIGFAQAATAERQKEGFGGRKKRRRRRKGGAKG